MSRPQGLTPAGGVPAPAAQGRGAGPSGPITPALALELAGGGALGSLLVNLRIPWDESSLGKLYWGPKGTPCPCEVGRKLGSVPFCLLVSLCRLPKTCDQIYFVCSD